jgi:hypothetical protein
MTITAAHIPAIVALIAGILIVSFFGSKPPSSDGEGFSRFFWS